MVVFGALTLLSIVAVNSVPYEMRDKALLNICLGVIAVVVLVVVYKRPLGSPDYDTESDYEDRSDLFLILLMACVYVGLWLFSSLFQHQK